MKIVITGASKGIGKGIATVLSKRGHSLGLLARSENLLLDLKATIEGWGNTCHIRACDIREAGATSLAITELVERLKGVDVLINNAGLVVRKDIFDLSIEEWMAMVETNINGVFFVTRSILPRLKTQKKGHIINISSISGRLPLRGGSGYAATKYAMTGFSESLFHEVRDYGIKVTTVFPGSVDTESHAAKASSGAEWKVTPEEIGEACQQIINTTMRNCISRLEIRPLRRPM